METLMRYQGSLANNVAWQPHPYILTPLKMAIVMTQAMRQWLLTRDWTATKAGQKEDVDLQQVVSWLFSNNIFLALPSSGSYWLQTLWSQKNQLLLKDGILYRQWLDVPGGGCNRHLQLVVPKSWVRIIAS